MDRKENKLDRTTEIFQKASIPKAVLFNVIPAIVSMLMVLLYNMADTFFIGQTHNAYMLAAVSLATPVFWVFIAVGMLFGVGGTSLISRWLGEGKKEDAKHVSSFCFWGGIGFGVIGMIGILIFADPLSRLVGASSDTLSYVREYLRIIAFGVPFLIISNSFSHIIRAEGNANQAMLGTIFGNVTNIVLDPLMIIGMGMNVRGAAIATVIGNVVSAGYYIWHLTRGSKILSIKFSHYRMSQGIVKGVFSIGIPASLNSFLMSSSNIVVNNLMTGHGDMAVAGLGVAMKVNMLVVMFLFGIGTGIQPVLGYCYGAGNRKRFIGVMKFSCTLALFVGVTMTTVCYLWTNPIVSAFLTDADAFSYGIEFSRIMILSGPILGLLFVMTNAIQAMGAGPSSMVLSISRQGIIYLPVLMSCNLIFHSADTLVQAQPLTDYLATILSVVLFMFTFRKYFRKRIVANA